MGTFLNNHPFAVEAFFERSLVLTYAFPKEDLAALIPPCVQLDTFNDRWAFIAVAMVQTTGLRPKGFQAILGNDFFLVGYRVFVRYTNSAGKRLRGLYILRSETDKAKMQWLGAIFTRYSYLTTDIHQAATGRMRTISSRASGLNVVVDTGEGGVVLPPGSPFTDWKQARRFAGPLPFTFSYDPSTKKVLIVEGVREDWQPRPVAVLEHDVAYLGTLGFKQPLLASAFIVEGIPYHWKKGRTEQWNA